MPARFDHLRHDLPISKTHPEYQSLHTINPFAQAEEKEFETSLQDVGQLTLTDLASIFSNQLHLIKNPKIRIHLRRRQSFKGWMTRDYFKKICDPSKHAFIDRYFSSDDRVVLYFLSKKGESELDLRRQEIKARVAYETISGRRKNEKPPEKPSLIHYASFAFAVAAAGFIGINIGRYYTDQQFKTDIDRIVGGVRVSSPPALPTIPDHPEKSNISEEKEVLAPHHSFEVVLDFSEPVFDSTTRRYSDNMLNPYAVSDHFLGGEFRYTGAEKRSYGGELQRINRFALMGSKSGYAGREGEAKERWKTTTLADSIHTLIDPNLSPEDLAAWIAWMYRESFNVSLDPRRIRIKRAASGQVETIFYDPPSEFDPEIIIMIDDSAPELAATEPGGNRTTRPEKQRILDSSGRLILPSGISPNADIKIPSKLMVSDPLTTIVMGGGIQWQGVSARDVANEIIRYERILKDRRSGVRDWQATGRAFGRDISGRLDGPAIDPRDPLLKKLVDFLLKDIPYTDHAQRITALITFVQNKNIIPYQRESNIDLDRPGFLTVFNGKGDCNNKIVLACELMLAAGYEAAILHVDDKDKNKPEQHVLLGIPFQYFPGKQAWRTDGSSKKWWVPAELTDEWGIGSAPLGEDQNMSVFHIEELHP